MKRLALLAVLVACSSSSSSSSTKPIKTVVPPVLPPPASAEQTCKAGQAVGDTRRYEHGIRIAAEQELGRYTVEATTKYPVDVVLGDKTFKIASPVRRCDGDGRMHFLGAQVESNGLRTIGFTPPPAQYDGFGAPANACQINPETYCKAACGDPKASACKDMRCRTMQNVPVFYECTNPIMHELARTTEPPTDEQKQRGITEVSVVERLVVREYEADAATGTWKSMVIVRELRREEVDPSKQDGGATR